MTIESYGYPGNFTANPERFAKMQLGLGRHMWVESAGSLLASPVQSGTRHVKLTGGLFGAYGVTDESDGELVQLPATVSGTRYWLIVAQRVWQTTNKTTIEIVDAGSDITTLPDRLDEIGVIDQQPLWLVPMPVGNVPGTPIDLRLIGSDNGPVQANSDLVRQYATWEGIEIVIGATRWRRGSGSGASGQWFGYNTAAGERRKLTPLTGGSVITPAVGNGTATKPEWVGAGLDQRALRDGNHVDVMIELRKASGSRRDAGQAGNFGDFSVGQLAADLRPPRPIPFAFYYRGGTGTGNSAIVGAIGELGTDGQMKLVSAAGDYGMNVESSGWTFRAHVTFLQES